MKNVRSTGLKNTTLELMSVLIAVLFFCCGAASAQSGPSESGQPTPAAALNLDSEIVAKEMSKGQHPGDVKPEVFSSAQSAFELSILNSESRKKVSGVVEAGAGVGTIPENRWHKAENLNCENAAVAISDQISKNTQIGLSAAVDNCRAK